MVSHWFPIPTSRTLAPMHRRPARRSAVSHSTALLAASLLALAGCGGASPRSTSADPGRLAPRRLFPLGEGYSWAYDNDPGNGLPRQTSVLHVTAFDSGRAVVESLATGNARTYELRDDGLFWVEQDAYLLHAPIEVGASWPSGLGRTARVTDVDVSVDVPTGHFDHCVEIRETRDDETDFVRTVFCADVGPTVIESRQRLSLGEVVATGRLQAYQQGPDDE